VCVCERERESARETERGIPHACRGRCMMTVSDGCLCVVFVSMCTYVCVCERERKKVIERERERERERDSARESG